MRLLKFSTNRYRSAEFGLSSFLSTARRNYGRKLAAGARDLAPMATSDGFINQSRNLGAAVGGLAGGIYGGAAVGIGNAARVAIENRGKPQEERRSILGAGLKGLAYGGAGGALAGGAAISKIGGDMGKRARTLNKRGVTIPDFPV